MSDKVTISEEVQIIVGDSVEALIRFYRSIIDGNEPNPTFLEAHKANMTDALVNHGISPDTYGAALIQTLCCTIIALVDDEDYQLEEDEL